MESKNPFAAIIDSYKYEVKKADERGLADTFKKCSEIFFRDATNEEIKFNFRDVEYLDGYFLFGMGTNSVVHFHIDECPGWKFGIWWGDKDENNNSVSGEFFAQFEDTIDKFKPSASQYCISITIDLDDDNLWSLYDVRDAIKYIANEPYLAFCRDYCYWDASCSTQKSIMTRLLIMCRNAFCQSITAQHYVITARNAPRDTMSLRR